MLIRPATLDDIPQMLPMIAQICALHDAWDSAKYGILPQVEQRYAPWLATLINDSRDLALVVEDSDASSMLVGLLIATVEQEIPIYRLKEFAFIHDLWVEPPYRHQGLARQLVMQAIAHFKQVGVRQVRLETAVPNNAARQLFESCGLRASAVEMLTDL
jgi:ribosomal protein S18 acetylase RimI-like enzyme